MKKLILVAIASLSLPIASQAAVLNLSVAATTGELTVFNGGSLPAGTPIQVGVFGADISTIDMSSFTSVVGNFVPMAFTTVGAGFGGVDGFVNMDVVLDDTSFNLQQFPDGQLSVIIGTPSLFVVVTNPAWAYDPSMFVDVPAPPNTLGLQIASIDNTPIGGVGSFDPDGGVTNPAAVPGALVLGLVPEPSSSLLALFALFLGVVRRKR